MFVLQKLLAKVADYDDRCQHLEALKNRLESLVSPAIVAAISSKNQGVQIMY